MFSNDKKIISDLTEAMNFWQNKFGRITIDQKYKSYYIMGVLGGIRIALDIVKNYTKRGK
jgi:hypothetical protein